MQRLETQNPHFLKKVQKGDQGKFLKNSPKSSPPLKGPKALWRKWHYPLISMHLNCKDWKRVKRKQRLQKFPNGQVMAVFARSPIIRIFWKRAKGGLRKKFVMNRPKSSPRLKGQQHSGANVIIPKFYPLIMQRLKKILAQKASPKLPKWPSYGNFCKVTQDPHFLKKCKGGSREIFQKSPKT